MANQGFFTAPLLSLVIAAPIGAQAPQPAALSWAGWARCQITIQAPGYSHRETHLWTMTGAGTTNANMEIYPASWTVTGDGSQQRVNGPTTVSAQWTVNGTLPNVTIGATRHLDRMTVQRWTNHGPARSGLTGTEISTTNGVPRSRAVVLDVQQWAFPVIETGPAATRATGSTSLPFDGLRGPMNPPSGALGTAACTWDFARGGVLPSAPPPSSVAAPTGSSGTPSAPATSPSATEVPRIVSVTPATIEAGSGCNNEITLTGDATHWGFGTVLDVGPGVRVAVIAPQSPTRLVALVLPDSSAPPGPRSVTVRAGSEVVTLPNAVAVVAREQPTVTVTPSSAPVDAGFVTVTLTGRGTRWEQGVTQVLVDTVTQNNTVRLEEFVVNSPTSVTLRLYVYGGGGGGANDIRIYNRRASSLPGGCDIITLPSGFTVTGAGSHTPPLGSALPSITAVTPAAAPPGTRALAVSITATGSHFVPGVSYVDFGELVGATSLTITSPTTATAIINVDPAAPPGLRNVTMTTPAPDGTTEILSRLAAFTVGSGQPPGATPPPSGTLPGSGTTAASGRYRITATSVYFHNAEADNPGPAIGDGKGDEIYLTSYAQVYDRRNGNQLSAGPLLRTPVHGDMSGAGGGARVRAGSATPNGGIATGDDVQLQMPGASPVWLWEGELRDGIDVVVLRPVLWEFDGNEAAWYTVYAQRFPPAAPRQVFDLPVVQSAIPRAGVAFETVPGFTMTGAWVADTQDHPLGSVLNVTGTGQVAGTWTDRVLTLTREKLEPWLTAAGGVGRVELRVWGEIHVGAAGPGATHNVRQEAVADYTLNVTVERRP